MNERFHLDHPETILGKRLIIDLTTLDHQEHLLDRQQLYGEIVAISETQGIIVRLLPSKDEFILPPDLRLFEPVPSGSHRLEPSGEVVDHVDLLAKRVIHNPPPEMQVEPLARTSGGPMIRKVPAGDL
jgi:hypothetical protein